MSQQLAHRWDMPESGLLCRRCRSGLCGEGETWCQLCSCAHALGEVARNRFSYPTHRALADEIAYQAVRQVRALVEVDRQTHSQVTSLSDRFGKLQSAAARGDSQHRQVGSAEAATE